VLTKIYEHFFCRGVVCGPWTQEEMQMSEYKDVKIPVTFAGLETKENKDGFNIKCQQHDWQHVSLDELKTAGSNAPSNVASFPQVQRTFWHIQKAERLQGDYTKGKVKGFAEYAARYCNLIKERKLWEMPTEAAFSLILPCGCSANVVLGDGRITFPPEPPLWDVISKFGFSTEDDWTLLNVAFINQPMNDTIRDACKKRAVDTLNFLEDIKKEEADLDNFKRDLDEVFQKHPLPLTDIKGHLLVQILHEIEEGKKLLIYAKIATVEEIMAPLMKGAGRIYPGMQALQKLQNER
jgi:hypothetical protein